jgi:NAD(P)-dependent dehydrogenase (short-subunit alcohol dehydrogenase family)
MEQWFEGKVALVTGGADGIGRASALLFARRGAKVVVTDINATKGEAVAQEIRNGGGEAVFALTNVIDRRAVEAAVQTAVDQFGGLHCALNNAGITHGRDPEWDDEAFDTTMQINVKGVLNCLRAEIPVMLKGGGGAIVNTASTSSFMASPAVAMPGYTASKHAIIGLTRTSALVYAKRNIRVNAICPGVTDTEMVRGVIEHSPEAREELENNSPMGRMGRPEEMAEAVAWLCSDKSSYITAHPLIIDGGFLAQ